LAQLFNSGDAEEDHHTAREFREAAINIRLYKERHGLTSGAGETESA
jgi:hypothetical protein